MTTQDEEGVQALPQGKEDRVKQVFQAISYLQYPFLLIALGCMLVPYFNGFDAFWHWLNKALVFAGLGVSFSTLQDPGKTQNKLSKRVWQDPVKGKRMLWIMSLTALALLVSGLYGMLVSKGGIAEEISFGTLMLGIGYIGLLKVAIEMHERHKVDSEPS